MNLQILYEMLPEGRENSIKLSEIAWMWGMNERRARKIMGEEMSGRDMIVCSLGDGYFRPAGRGEIDSFYRYYDSYCRRMLKRRYRIKKARENWGQVRMDIRGNDGE
jgi:hypothetical protein